MEGDAGSSVDAGPVNMDDTDARHGKGDDQQASRAVSGTIASDGDRFERYRMDHAERGMAIIINNRKFQDHTGMGERRGTDTDAAQLMQRFKQLEFKVHMFHNRTKAEMQQISIEAAKKDHSDSDAFVFCVLSHGDDGVVYGVDGTVQLDNLVAPFKGDKCKTLAGKPKLFFIQACRGNQLDSGAEVFDSGDMETDEPEIAHRIPAEADFLMAYSVVPGYFSWRNSTKGSWFIQALCQVLERYGTRMELLHIMTRVNRKVAYEFESNAAQNTCIEYFGLYNNSAGEVLHFLVNFLQDTSLGHLSYIAENIPENLLTVNLLKLMFGLS